MRWRYTIVTEGVVEADTKAEAQTAAFEQMDHGQGVFGCEVEELAPLLREVTRDE